MGFRKKKPNLKALLAQMLEKTLKAEENVISGETAANELPSVTAVLDAGWISDDEAALASTLRRYLFDFLRQHDVSTAEEIWNLVKQSGASKVISRRAFNSLLKKIQQYKQGLESRRPRRVEMTFAAAVQGWMDEHD